MSNPEEIRTEVDELVGDIKDIVEAAIGVGKGTTTKMQLAIMLGGKFPSLLMNGMEFQQANRMEKVDYCLEGFDALTGTDEDSLLEELPYIGPEATEQVFDMVKGGLRTYLLTKIPESSIPA